MLLTGLDAIAAKRGDGLHPELRRLFAERAERAAYPSLVEICPLLPETHIQAGPNPAPPMRDIPEGVVRFPGKGKRAA